MKDQIPLLTVGELIQELSAFDSSFKVSFSGLDFNRLKLRDENLVQIEFNPHVYRNAEGLVVVQNPE